MKDKSNKISNEKRTTGKSMANKNTYLVVAVVVVVAVFAFAFLTGMFGNSGAKSTGQATVMPGPTMSSVNTGGDSLGAGKIYVDCASADLSDADSLMSQICSSGGDLSSLAAKWFDEDFLRRLVFGEVPPCDIPGPPFCECAVTNTNCHTDEKTKWCTCATICKDPCDHSWWAGDWPPGGDPEDPGCGCMCARGEPHCTGSPTKS